MDIDMAALRQLEADKDIPISVVIEALEDAMLNAYEHRHGRAAAAGG